MTVTDIAQVLGGYLLIVAIGASLWSVILFITHSDRDLPSMSKKGRIIYQVGQWTVVFAVFASVIAMAWALGKLVFKG